MINFSISHQLLFVFSSSNLVVCRIIFSRMKKYSFLFFSKKINFVHAEELLCILKYLWKKAVNFFASLQSHLLFVFLCELLHEQIGKRVKKRSKKVWVQTVLFLSEVTVSTHTFAPFFFSHRTNSMRNRSHPKWTPYNFFNTKRRESENLSLLVSKMSTKRSRRWPKSSTVGNTSFSV